MGKKVSVIEGLAFMLIVNAAKGSILFSQCAKDTDECDPHHQNPCCSENSKCKWLSSANQYQCIKKAILGDFCVSNDDCNDILHSTCSPKKQCVCRQNNIRINITNCAPLLDEFCWKESCAPENSLCVDNECKCKTGFLAHSNDRCMPTLLGSPCEDETTCSSITFAKCSSQNICICPENTIEMSPIFCSLLLGEYCKFDDECGITNSECVDNKCQCKHQYISYSNTECKLSYLEMPCRSLSDCDNDIRALECIDNTCKCGRSYASSDKNMCLLSLTRKCWHNDDCRIVNSACIANLCQCKPNYLFKNSKCLPRFLDGPCHLNRDCSNIQSALCIEDKCTCIDGFFSLNRTACVRALKSLGEVCWTNEDCISKYSHCFQNRCECYEGYIQTSYEKCLTTELRGLCSNDDDCKIIPNARCSKNNQCICKNNYVEENSISCVQLLKETCSNENQCNPEYSVIEKNHHCNEHHIEQFINKSTEIFLEQTCLDDEDCSKILNGRCSEDNICECKPNYSKFDRTVCLPLIGGHCEEHKECLVYNSNCLNKTCQCLEDYISLSNTKCLSNFFSSVCYSTTDCQDIINSHCSRFNRCVCNLNFMASRNGICVPILGAHCSTDSSCRTPNSKCIDQKCQCKSTFTRGEYNDCLPTQLEEYCDRAYDCGKIRHSKCIKNKCVCRNNYIALNSTVCGSLLNGICFTKNDCVVANSDCVKNKCKCNDMYMEQYLDKCVPISLGNRCLSDISCRLIQKAVCSPNKICVCNSNTFAVDTMTCAPLLNTSCRRDECKIESSHCIRRKCQCKPGHSAVSANQCVETSSLYSCTDITYCADSWHFDCSKEKKCVCKANNFVVNNSSCLPVLGGVCWEDHQCVTRNSICVDFRCRCQSGFTPVSHNMCTPTDCK